MIGQATARLEAPPRRYVQRLWGHPYLHARQDWQAVWPLLARLPPRGLTVLDAGCGPGRWTLELAAMRPEWHIVGLDRDPECLHRAELARRRLGLSNVAFVRSQFGEFRSARGFDVVLSVCSAHYLVEAGRGTELFEWFRDCLRPGGRLILYGPRRSSEAPFTSWLPRFNWHPVFSASELRELCRGSRLVVAELESRIGRPGTMAKQLDALAHRAPRRSLLSAGLYPLEWLCQVIDVLGSRPDASASLMWLLVACLNDVGPSTPTAGGGTTHGIDASQGILPGRQP